MTDKGDYLTNKRIASSDASLPKGDRQLRGIREEPEGGTVLGTTLRSMQQPMRRISWAASLCLPLSVDNYLLVDECQFFSTHMY